VSRTEVRRDVRDTGRAANGSPSAAAVALRLPAAGGPPHPCA